MQLTSDLEAAGGPVVSIVGEVDLASAGQLRSAGRAAVTAAESGAQIVLDIRGVTFLDSTGVGALVDIVNAAAEKGTSVVLRSTPDRVRKILEITGVLDRFSLEP
ncbi:MAG TPA: STAS domain-containing protein [Jatrophihabitantaceae bacterium]|nr:STAS domain-containing protein [Jatrophihabitantaceae bacterium]